MLMKHLVVLLSVVVIVLTMSAADAQWYRNMARGDTMIADPAFSTAWLANPAVLASLAAPADGEVAKWHNEASADIKVSGEDDFWGVDWGGFNAAQGWGVGAGYWDSEWGKEYGVGVGKAFKDFSVGIGWQRQDEDSVSVPDSAQYDTDDSWDFFQVGLYKNFEMADETSSVSNVRAGAVWWDVTDEIDSAIDLGIAVDFVEGFTVAVDWLDFDTINFGASTKLGKAKEFEVAAGLSDGDLTVGANYDITHNADGGNWKVGFAWADYEWDDVAQAGVTYVW
jgi:hypothetical protein